MPHVEPSRAPSRIVVLTAPERLRSVREALARAGHRVYVCSDAALLPGVLAEHPAAVVVLDATADPVASLDLAGRLPPGGPPLLVVVNPGEEGPAEARGLACCASEHLAVADRVEILLTGTPLPVPARGPGGAPLERLD